MVGVRSLRARSIRNEMEKKGRTSRFFFSKLISEAKIEASKRNLPLRVMFQDEARFGRINTPRNCWAPKGVRPIVGKQIVREYTYLYGAFAPKDGKADFLILPYMDNQCMSLFLKEISERYPDEYILMFWDGAPCHSEGKLSIPANIMLDTLPPYSPDLNPSENIWDDMRENFFHNITFDSMKAVESVLEKAANFYENNSSVVKSITGWEWILSAL